MAYEQLLEELTGIFRDVLDNDSIVLTEETTANDIEEWDSISHIQLVVAVEKHFKTKFSNGEIQKWRKVGDMCVSIEEKKS
ncbi:MAG: acyl carrier protein [Filimonas sp.]|nr:acyl carrier protein [Filimonas sp.]